MTHGLRRNGDSPTVTRALACWAHASMRGVAPRGDFVIAQRRIDRADGIEHAVITIENALFDAFDLWDQYEQQDS
jgi:hypothetical protein